MAQSKNYAYKNNWNKENLDRVNLTMEKGKKAELQAYAKQNNESLNGFINRAIDAILAEEQEKSNIVMLPRARNFSKRSSSASEAVMVAECGEVYCANPPEEQDPLALFASAEEIRNPAQWYKAFKSLNRERNFFEWFNKEASEDEKTLADHVLEYSDEYFSDFRFELGTVVDEFTNAESSSDDGKTWEKDPIRPNYPFLEYFDQLVLESLQYKVEPFEEENCVGMFNTLEFSLTISPNYLDDKSVILHELIHIYEHVIDIMPKFYHDILLICLYNDLKNKVDNLDERIQNHTHVYMGEEITADGGDHDILFYLKSLDLDLRCGYTLGTVCGYGRDEFSD